MEKTRNITLTALVIAFVFLVAILIPYIGEWGIYTDYSVLNFDVGVFIPLVARFVMAAIVIIYNTMFLRKINL